MGRFAEYFVQMEFALYGFEVYTAEVDDRRPTDVGSPTHGRRMPMVEPDELARLDREREEMTRVDAEARELVRAAVPLLAAGRREEAAELNGRAVEKMQWVADAMDRRRQLILAWVEALRAGRPGPG